MNRPPTVIAIALFAALAISGCGAGCDDVGAGGDAAGRLPPLAHLPAADADRVRAARARAVELDTGGAWEDYGRVLYVVGEQTAAELALVRAVEREGADRAACLHAAGVAALGRAPDRAVRHFEAALDAGSGAALSTRMRLAVTLEELARLDEAEEHYRTALAYGPIVHAFAGLGRIALAREDLTAATDHLEHAHALAPEIPEVRIALAQVLARAGHHDRARLLSEGLSGWHRSSPVADPYLADFLRRPIGGEAPSPRTSPDE